MKPDRAGASNGSCGLAIDVGERRIGVAGAELTVRFARPLITLEQPESFVDDIIELCREHDAAWLVIGLPRGLEGQETPQTIRVQAFGDELIARMTETNVQIPVYWIDEALTSVKAEQELRNRGKPYTKPAVDALAATYILEDFMQEQTAQPQAHVAGQDA